MPHAQLEVTAASASAPDEASSSIYDAPLTSFAGVYPCPFHPCSFMLFQLTPPELLIDIDYRQHKHFNCSKEFMQLTDSDFPEMWYQIFLWALFSSIFVHTIAAGICFATLRKHKYGKFFPLLILIMGVLMPLTSGVVSSAAVAFVYGSAGYQMAPQYALLWGIGQTVLAACVGFTRILATL
ncbi:hypothetical protein TSAR_011912 [Trichomalopsis sarcophagae]|uniref:Transmembrane protein 170A n=1 Tax=Trichomalopsis sarcophagae TaxID=543379 RepID=A0A232F302_9HYME|nr:hypothetical protein TSAR_011912 [Trichomalopsis sarcophagae]